MASPQKENGYTAVANEILEVLSLPGINGSEFRIIHVVLRKTYGYRKKEDIISLSQFQKCTRMNRSHVIRTIKSLVHKRVLLKQESSYKFNKNWEQWLVHKRVQGVHKRVTPSTQKGTKSSTQKGTHKRKKEIYTKESKSQLRSDTIKVNFEQIDMELAVELHSLIKKNTPTFKKPNLDKWAEHVRLMRERDSRTVEQIRYAIQWSQNDDFWQANILSTKKLREKFDTLVAQIKRGSQGRIAKL